MTVFVRLALAAACAVLAACQTPCPAPETTRTVRYLCEDESELVVTFTRDNAHIVQEGYAPLDLPTNIAAGGYRYVQGGSELRGSGREVRWTRPGAEETMCRRQEE